MGKQRGQVLVSILAALVGVLIGAAIVWGWVSRQAPAMNRVDMVSCPTTVPPVSKAGQDAITAAVKRVGPAVVNIRTTIKPTEGDPLLGIPDHPFPREGEGSGIIIDGPRGYVLTNAHVVKDTSRVTVQLASGRSFDARVVGADPMSEIAVVQIPGREDLPFATLGDSAKLPIGAWVIAIGNPFGFQNTVTVGVLSAKNRQVAGPNGVLLQELMQTDASINPGNSVGALVDLNGNVIGVPTAMIPQAQGIGFAVPIDVAQQVAARLVKTGAMPWLGISHRKLRPQEVEAFAAPDGKGSLVVGVLSGSPAEAAGLRPGDILLRIGATTIRDTNDVGRAVRSHDVGARVPVVVWRERHQVRLEVTLGSPPPSL